MRAMKVALMVCDNPKAYAIRRAQKHHVPFVVVNPKLFSSRAKYEKFLVRILKNQKIDVVVLAGFMRIFTPYFIKAYRNRIVNIHPSLLPAFKGSHAIRDAFDAGVRETGVTVHLVTENLDAGLVLERKKLKILPRETLSSLERKIHALEHRLYSVAIQKFLNERVNACQE